MYLTYNQNYYTILFFYHCHHCSKMSPHTTLEKTNFIGFLSIFFVHIFQLLTYSPSHVRSLCTPGSIFYIHDFTLKLLHYFSSIKNRLLSLSQHLSFLLLQTQVKSKCRQDWRYIISVLCDWLILLFYFSPTHTSSHKKYHHIFQSHSSREWKPLIHFRVILSNKKRFNLSSNFEHISHTNNL